MAPSGGPSKTGMGGQHPTLEVYPAGVANRS